MGTLGATIKDTDVRPTVYGSNNDTDNEFDIGALSVLSKTIKNTNIESTIGEANNNTNTKFDASVFMGGLIRKTDAELTIGGLRKANIIIEKKYVNLICSDYC